MSITILCLSVALGAEPQPYPKGELLIEPAALAERLDKTIILDTRPARAYDAGHIPGALRVDAAEWSKKFNAAGDENTWSMILGRLGIAVDSSVVVYGDSWTDAARVWWIARYWGVKDVRLLNGTFATWKAARGKVSTEAAAPRPIVAQVRPSARLATKSEVLGIIKDRSAQILDVRSLAEFCGAEGTAKRKGAIPGAGNLEWKEFIDARTQRLKPAGELAELLKKAGIDPAKPIVTYCQSGGRASVAAFVLELMGGERVQNYYRSWAEWGNDADTPVVKPEKR